jgi:hypothetical protein
MTRKIHKNTDCLNINLVMQQGITWILKQYLEQKIKIFFLEKITLNLLKICMGMRK